jgi:hypothetical protein
MRLSDDIIECARLETRIMFAVAECNRYISATHPTVHEMEDVAWVLRSDPRRNQIGFVAPGKLKAHERYEAGYDRSLFSRVRVFREISSSCVFVFFVPSWSP